MTWTPLCRTPGYTLEMITLIIAYLLAGHTTLFNSGKLKREVFYIYSSGWKSISISLKSRDI